MELNFIINGEHIVSDCEEQDILKDVAQREITKINGGSMEDYYIALDDDYFRGEKAVISYVENKQDRFIFISGKKSVVNMPYLEA